MDENTPHCHTCGAILEDENERSSLYTGVTNEQIYFCNDHAEDGVLMAMGEITKKKIEVTKWINQG